MKQIRPISAWNMWDFNRRSIRILDSCSVFNALKSKCWPEIVLQQLLDNFSHNVLSKTNEKYSFKFF